MKKGWAFLVSLIVMMLIADSFSVCAAQNDVVRQTSNRDQSNIVNYGNKGSMIQEEEGDRNIEPDNWLNTDDSFNINQDKKTIISSISESDLSKGMDRSEIVADDIKERKEQPDKGEMQENGKSELEVQNNDSQGDNETNNIAQDIVVEGVNGNEEIVKERFYKREKRYNIELVIDASGSLINDEEGNDKEGLRYEALKVFLGLVANRGNRVGAIVFNDKKNFPVDEGIRELSTIEDKKELIKKIEEVTPEGHTDLGGALARAWERLNEEQEEDRGPDENLENCIILFSDGGLYLENKDAMKVSQTKMENTVKAVAADGKTKIYWVYLNSGNNSTITEGNVGYEEDEIATPTGGRRCDINSADELSDAYIELFDEVLYPGETPEPEIVTENEYEKELYMPTYGVDEISLLIEGLSNDTELSLTEPNNHVIEGSAIDDISITAGDKRIIKIENPGEENKLNVILTWTLNMSKTDSHVIKIRTIYNTVINAELKQDEDNEHIFNAYLLDGEKFVESENVYCSEYEGELVLINPTTQEEKKYVMDVSNPESGAPLCYICNPLEVGDFYARIQIKLKDEDVIVYESEGRDGFSIHNNLPTVKEHSQTKYTFEKHLWKEEPSITLDLNDLFYDYEDPEYKTLTYAVKWSDLSEIEEGVLPEYPDEERGHPRHLLVISPEKAGEGKIIFSATDEQGETTDAEISIVLNDYTNNEIKKLISDIVLALFIILTIIMLGVLLYKYWRGRGVCKWTITVRSFCSKRGLEKHTAPFAPISGFRYKKELCKWLVLDSLTELGEFYAVPRFGEKEDKLVFRSKKKFSYEFIEGVGRSRSKDYGVSRKIELKCNDRVLVYTYETGKRCGIEILVTEELGLD